MLTWLRQFNLRTQMTSLTTIAVGLTVALAALASYLVVSHQMFKQVDDSLSSVADTAFSIGGHQNFDYSTAENVLAKSGDLIQVIGPSGPPVYSAAQPLPDTQADQAVVANPGTTIVRTVRVNDQQYRMITISESSDNRKIVLPDGTPVALQIAHPLTDVEQTLSDLRLILLIVGLAGIGVSLIFGYVIARTAIRPVARLTAAAEHVAATQQLDARIEEQGNDELTRLARAFNAMLGALGASREQQAQLVSDAGHELRTPLTSLRTNIEVLMRVESLPEADRRELLQDVHAQLEELTTLIGDIVELGRHDEQRAEPADVHLDQLVERAVERARRRAQSLTFRVQLEPGLVRAQPALLERAVLNVLDNAAKWSPAGGYVDVWLRRQDRWLLDIRDYGPGIAPEDLPHVFDRFYRAPTSRAMPGSGLGLAIVSKVVTDHGGTASITCPPDGGTNIHIELPVVDGQDAYDSEDDVEPGHSSWGHGDGPDGEAGTGTTDTAPATVTSPEADDERHQVFSGFSAPPQP